MHRLTPRQLALVSVLPAVLIASAAPLGIRAGHLVPHQAWAARSDAGKALSDQAAARFQEGKFLEAADLFERAFALSPDKLVRLRNAGRAYEEAGRLDYARLLFDRYLHLAPEGPEKQEVRERMAQLDARIAEAQAQAAAQAAAAATPTAAPASGTVGEAGTLSADSGAPRWAAWATVGACAVLVGAGAGWAIYTEQQREVVEGAAGRGEYSYPGGVAVKLKQDREAISLNRTLAWSTMGVGAAAAVAGTLWAIWPSSPRTAALIPWSHSPGASLALRF